MNSTSENQQPQQDTDNNRPPQPVSLQKQAIYYGLIAGLLFSIFAAIIAPALSDIFLFVISHVHHKHDGQSSTSDKKTDICIDRLKRDLAALLPSSPYLIVSSSDNTFVVKKGANELRRGVCSTGSYVLLKSRDNGKKWMFSTPRGMLKVRQKLVDPVWRMPDWAFIEEGKPVPPPDSPERFERGVLGEYAMILGGGYMIHGTLYQRFLGMPVTHGCVRLGDDDLEAVYSALNIGSIVLMY